jgi:hypothetical protein
MKGGASYKNIRRHSAISRGGISINSALTVAKATAFVFDFHNAVTSMEFFIDIQ